MFSSLAYMFPEEKARPWLSSLSMCLWEHFCEVLRLNRPKGIVLILRELAQREKWSPSLFQHNVFGSVVMCARCRVTTSEHLPEERVLESREEANIFSKDAETQKARGGFREP